jgi:hypothetical protein
MKQLKDMGLHPKHIAASCWIAYSLLNPIISRFHSLPPRLSVQVSFMIHTEQEGHLNDLSVPLPLLQHFLQNLTHWIAFAKQLLRRCIAFFIT